MLMDVPITSETAARLAARSAATGTAVEQLVADAVTRELDGAGPIGAPAGRGDRFRVLADLVASLPRRDGVRMDDSRESIYGNDGR